MEDPTTAPAYSSEFVEKLIEQNQKLMTALAVERQAHKLTPAGIGPDAEVYPVTNISGTALIFSVTDYRGNKKHFALDKRGDVAKLSREQVMELRSNAPHFFEQGYVSCPDLVEPNGNTIPDLATFVATLPLEEINERVNAITAPTVLMDLFNYIENQRFTHLDEQGNPLVEQDGAGEKQFVLKEKQISPKLMALQSALQRRIHAVMGLKVSLDG